jgi:hypothetical protein
VPTALEVADHDNDGGGPGDTTLANQDYQSQEIKGLGRFWVDSDTNELWIYTDKVELEDSASSAGFVPASVGQYNFLYNGSFEISASGAASPSIPDGWTNDGLATTATQATGITEGSGFAFNGIANSANDALTQTLLGEGLKPSTTYLVYGRVSPQVTTCSIVTTGAGTQADVTSASGGGVWETLLDTFITDANAPPTDVVVRLESDANGSDCDWDHIFVVEYMPRRLLPERLYDIDCVAWTSDAVTEPALEALTVRFRNPWPSAVVKLGAQNIVADQNNSNTILEWERPSGTEIATYERPRDDGTTPSRHNITMPYMDVNLVPGTEYVYQIDIDATLVDPGISSPVAASICIWLEAYPL